MNFSFSFSSKLIYDLKKQPPYAMTESYIFSSYVAYMCRFLMFETLQIFTKSLQTYGSGVDLAK